MKTFVYGPAGSGKTSRGLQRLDDLIQFPTGGVLVYVPQRTLAEPYYDLIRTLAGGQPDVLTIGGLSRRMADLFWPMVAEEAGFAQPSAPPVFLNLETSQYFMAKVLEPLIQDGLFESVTINRNRLYTQVLDNLNKAALNGYDLQTLGERLKLGDIGDPEQTRIYQDAMLAAKTFRTYCLTHNLVDFSLQLNIFTRHLWIAGGLCQEYLIEQYPHLIADNLEETTPIEHDILREWLPHVESALLLYDTEAGYRTFLGADPDSAFGLRSACDEIIGLEAPDGRNPVFVNLIDRLGQSLKRQIQHQPGPLTLSELSESFVVTQSRFFPEMLDGVADTISALVADEGVPPSEIVVLSPFLSDALRYSLSEKLALRGIQARSHRPSRSLRDEPVSQALHTLALAGHPEWELIPSRFDLAYAFLQVFSGIDLVRAQLLAESVLGVHERMLALKPFGELSFEVRDRITYSVGERYDRLLGWLTEYQQQDLLPLDHFWGLLFGELLSQPGYGFHDVLSVGEVAANLIDSARNFRWMNEDMFEDYAALGREYLHMMQEGVIAAQYLRSWQAEDENTVLMAPAYTFLMRNKMVEYQFWLDIGSHGWHERIFQPLTHPFVLNRNWPIDRYWSDADEVERENDALFRLLTGLLRRCQSGVFLAMSDLSESGYESQGLMIRTLHNVYQQIALEAGGLNG